MVKRMDPMEAYPLFLQYRNRLVIVRMADGKLFKGYVQKVDPANVYLVYSRMPGRTGRVILPFSLISSVGLID